ncbi:aspartic proteinase Asp1-like protein, partial [Tanacetum coccineum]
MSPGKTSEQYSLGTAELYFGGTTGMKDLPVELRNDIRGLPLYNANDDDSLPVCWKGMQPFRLVQEVKPYFKPITLSFTTSNNVRFQLDPEAYLINSKHGNVCLGILNGKEVGLGDMNLIGDIS